MPHEQFQSNVTTIFPTDLIVLMSAYSKQAIVAHPDAHTELMLCFPDKKAVKAYQRFMAPHKNREIRDAIMMNVTFQEARTLAQKSMYAYAGLLYLRPPFTRTDQDEAIIHFVREPQL